MLASEESALRGATFTALRQRHGGLAWRDLGQLYWGRDGGWNGGWNGDGMDGVVVFSGVKQYDNTGYRIQDINITGQLLLFCTYCVV